MLGDLQVKNFAIIDQLQITFTEGLNILTGETGAGKSIIIGALELLFGARASGDLIKAGKEVAYIEASYFINLPERLEDLLEEAGVEIDPEILLLSREIRRNGRNRCRINGQLVPLRLIQEISSYLVDIHGQHQHQNLLRTSYHIELLDELLAEDIKQQLEEITEIYYELKELVAEKAELKEKVSQRARRLDIIAFQLEEIENANLVSGELEEVKSELNRLEHMEDIAATVYKASNQLVGDERETTSLLDQLGIISSDLSDLVEYDQSIKDLSDLAQDSYYSLQELNFQLQDYQQDLDYDQSRLKELRSRLDVINTLRRKYGETIAEIMKYKNSLVDERDNLEEIEERLSKINAAEKELQEKYDSLDEKISQARKEQAAWLEERLEAELTELAMDEARFQVAFTQGPATPRGTDKVQFKISPNLGGELQDLNKIASGGEISRIMLAFKTIIAGHDRVKTIIFDEIETGVGGETARQVAARLYRISLNRQVISISHLPQIASLADRHFFIYKETEAGTTTTRIDRLNKAGRKEEIARMISGDHKTAAGLQHAGELIAEAETMKGQFKQKFAQI
ncbi:MAG: DNA repair protein RecN [Bacillota bacterium]